MKSWFETKFESGTMTPLTPFAAITAVDGSLKKSSQTTSLAQQPVRLRQARIAASPADLDEAVDAKVVGEAGNAADAELRAPR